jgi:hypothetical protein
VFAVRRSQIEGVQLRSCGERCAQVVFVQVIANEINQQIPVKTFYQAGIAVALPYGCI